MNKYRIGGNKYSINHSLIQEGEQRDTISHVQISSHLGTILSYQDPKTVKSKEVNKAEMLRVMINASLTNWLEKQPR